MANVAWGIDFGSRATKIVQVRREGEKVTIERALIVEHGRDLGEALREAGLSVREGIVGLAGKDCMLRVVKVPQAPPKRLDMIMEFEIGELTKRSKEPMCGAYHIGGAFEAMSDQLLATVALVRERTTEQIYQNLRAAGAACHAFLPTPFALYNAFMSLKNHDPSGLYILCDIGEQSTTLAVAKDGAFILGRTMPLGSAEFAKSIATALSVSQKEAENILLREGVVKQKNWKDERQKQISDALSGVVDRLVLGIRSAINTVQRQMRVKQMKVDKVLLFGGGARLEGLKEAMGRLLKTEVDVPNILPPPVNAYPETDPRPGLYEQVPARDAHAISPTGSELAIAVGLALSALGSPFLRLDLLPPVLRRKIEFRERYVWLIAAAALLLVFVVLVGLAVGREKGTAAERNNLLKRQMEQLEARRSALAAMRKKLNQARSLLKDLQEVPAVNKGVVRLLADLHSPKYMPESISLESVEFNRTWQQEEDLLWLFGTVNAEVGTEMGLVRRFAATLAKLPYVAEVEVDPEATKRCKGRFVFRIGLRFIEEER